MIAAFLAVLTWKMAIYTVLLVSVMVRLSVWRKRAQQYQDGWKASDKKLFEAQQQLITMGKAIDQWRIAANNEAAHAQTAQREAAGLRQKYEGEVQKVLSTPVTDAGALDFLRQEAAK
jgi:hypothetical protein